MNNPDRLPPDLPGGWEFIATFEPVKLQAGQIWRKRGPIDAIKIERVMLPGYPENDGGAPGISFRPTIVNQGGRVVWSRKTWFKLGTHEELHQWLKESGYKLAKNETT